MRRGDPVQRAAKRDMHDGFRMMQWALFLYLFCVVMTAGVLFNVVADENAQPNGLLVLIQIGKWGCLLWGILGLLRVCRGWNLKQNEKRRLEMEGLSQKEDQP